MMLGFEFNTIYVDLNILERNENLILFLNIRNICLLLSAFIVNFFLYIAMDLTKTKIRTTNQICFTNSHSWDEKTKRVELYCTCSFASSTLNNCESNHDRCSPKEGWMYLFLRLQQRELGFIEVVIFIGRKGINPEAENKCCNNAKP